MKTKEEFFEFEKKQRVFFDDYYKKKGWECRRISGKENKKYDCLVLVGKRWIKIQEKARSGEYDDFLVELVQDLGTGDRGWLYTCQADWILYKTPNNLFAIDKKRLDVYMKRCGPDCELIISNKGWGRTVNAVLSWEEIIKEKIGRRISLDKLLKLPLK